MQRQTTDGQMQLKVAEEHKAHILVSLLGEPDLIEGASYIQRLYQHLHNKKIVQELMS